ncbi:MAG: class I SAM-dependent methyltransferase [Anaerolineae bacterium]
MMEPAWKQFMIDYNEGLGVVYERFVLNNYLERLVTEYNIKTVLEAPIYGMAGVSGINSVPLAQWGCSVTLIDTDAERLADVVRLWDELGLSARFIHREDLSTLPFSDGVFDMAWEWAALWHVAEAEALLKELVRVSGKIVFVAMPNRWQVGYLMRKYLVDKEFFATVNESWADMGWVKGVLRGEGLQVVEEGVMDIPPWPDTVMPAAQFLERLGLRSKRLQNRFSGDDWRWSSMDYYLGRRADLKELVERYTFLEKLPLPWQLKAIWAHHRYVLGLKR